MVDPRDSSPALASYIASHSIARGRNKFLLSKRVLKANKRTLTKYKEEDDPFLSLFSVMGS
jgi:hypothetical protein